MIARVVDPGLSFIGLGLAASFFWGASDFLGGLATRKAHVFLVVAVAHSLSLGLLLLIAGAMHSPIPAERYALFGLCAGVFGGMALILYYQALSLGAMGLTTAVTGLLTSVVPVVYSFATQGLPKLSQIAGFIWQRPPLGSLPTCLQASLDLSVWVWPFSLVLGLACFSWC